MNPQVLSLYIHFPFCASKCRYCDFYSDPKSIQLIDTYLQALVKEWEYISKQKSCADAVIKTIYFGGGTPSLLSTKQFTYLFRELIARLNLTELDEWSVECNPDSFTEEKSALYLSHGVTRLTFGVQSLCDSELRLLGRRHTAQKAIQTLMSPSLSKYHSIGADLMYGIPLQTLESYQQSLSQLLSISNVKHLSLYELTINENTPFGRHFSKLSLPDEDVIGQMYELGNNMCAKYGLEHYEISNFSYPKFRSRHNEVYWDHNYYIGLGAAAHSYIYPYRWANICKIDQYIQKCFTGESAIDFQEQLDGVKLAHELIFLGLRKKSGINEIQFKELTGRNFCTAKNNDTLSRYVKEKLIEYDYPFWRPSERGMLFADAMARDLFD